MKLLLIFLVCLPAFACRTPKEFVKSISGDYKILLANWKTQTDKASIQDGDEAVFILPYCDGPTCDPNYVSMSYDKLKIVETTLSAKQTLYTLTYDSDTYYVVKSAESLTVVNPQYQIGDRKALVHILEKSVGR